MSMYAVVKALDRYPTAGTKFRARFDLVRHSSRLECVWTCDDGFVITADFADRDPGRWSARDTLSVIDPFVEAIEEGLRPDPVPDGFEVWRFDHASRRRGRRSRKPRGDRHPRGALGRPRRDVQCAEPLRRSRSTPPLQLIRRRGRHSGQRGL